ncbi:MAG: ABC transporter ATP-binding protein [Nitriliruptoraceae bacterium]
MTDIALANVSVTLLGARVVDGVSAEVPTGSWMSLIGPNGAGKTTLLRAVAGGVAHEGRIEFDGTELRNTGTRERARAIALVPQQPERPEGTRVLDYVLLGRSPYIPYLGMERPDDLAIAHAQLDRLELSSLARRSVTTLSGGEFQRAVLARALAQQAPVLLLDEPTSSLDLGHAQHVLELVDELRAERGLTVISALHDLTLAGQFSDELVLLVDGRVVARGATDAVLTAPLIATHYQANVRVVTDDVAGTVLVPVRSDARTPPHETAV